MSPPCSFDLLGSHLALRNFNLFAFGCQFEWCFLPFSMLSLHHHQKGFFVAINVTPTFWFFVLNTVCNIVLKKPAGLCNLKKVHLGLVTNFPYPDTFQMYWTAAPRIPSCYALGSCRPVHLEGIRLGKSTLEAQGLEKEEMLLVS